MKEWKKEQKFFDDYSERMAERNRVQAIVEQMREKEKAYTYHWQPHPTLPNTWVRKRVKNK